MNVSGMTGAPANAIPSTTTAAASTSSTTSFVPGGSLGENAFLQLLATQLQYQDPLQPQDNTQFVAQLAQFSSLEQMTNVSTQEGQVVSGINSLASQEQLTSAFSLLGNSVTLQDASGTQASGTVSAVQSTANGVMITVNGTEYPVADVQSVSK
ncbi:MAG: flagellar hook capping protein [Firmicutes bacterium]|nr:flagellar hook capping protein [Bacillota bacterium]